MSKTYRVFLGAPTSADAIQPSTSYSWRTYSSKPNTSMILPANILEAASQKISLLYKDTVFGEENEVEESVFNNDADSTDQSTGTVFTWPSTSNEDDSSPVLDLNSTVISNVGDPSLLHSDENSFSMAGSQSFAAAQSWSESSISRFPTFHFSLHTLSSLSFLSAQATESPSRPNLPGRKVNLLLAILEVEGPDSIRIKKGVDAGKELSVLKIILGDEQGNVCKLTAWREVVEEWGATAMKRGDVVYLENVSATCEPSTSISLSASSYLKSKLTICYRTMPWTIQDGKFRPDLRLSMSEPCVRRVTVVVRWFEMMAGLNG